MYMSIVVLVAIAVAYFSIREAFRILRRSRSGEGENIPAADRYDIVSFILEKVFGL